MQTARHARCTGAPLRGLRRLHARARTGTMRARTGTLRARSVAQPLAPARRADPSQRVMAVSQLIAHMGVRVDPAEVEEALRELPHGASVLDWYGQMTAQEQARRCVVVSVLMEMRARTLPGDVCGPPCTPHGVQPVPGVWPLARVWGCTPLPPHRRGQRRRAHRLGRRRCRQRRVHALPRGGRTAFSLCPAFGLQWAESRRWKQRCWRAGRPTHRSRRRSRSHRCRQCRQARTRRAAARTCVGWMRSSLQRVCPRSCVGGNARSCWPW